MKPEAGQANSMFARREEWCPPMWFRRRILREKRTRLIQLVWQPMEWMIGPMQWLWRMAKVAVQGGGFSIVYLDGGKYNGSYKIPYESIVPTKGECDNLIVPVCVSASHIAFTSLRMEPVWMILGESAGVAAALAIDAGIPVQDVSYETLRPKLDELGQKLVRGARWKTQRPTEGMELTQAMECAKEGI